MTRNPVRYISFAVLSLSAAAAAAAPLESQGTPKEKAIRNLMICTADILGNMNLQLDYLKAANGDKAAEKAFHDGKQELYKCTDEKLPPAVEASVGHDDLKNAIKEMYIKQRAYIGDMHRRNPPSWDDLSQMMDRVTMEMKLAHLD